MKFNKYLIIPLTFIFIVGFLILKQINNEGNLELDSLILENQIDYGTVENIVAERKGLDSTLWKDEVLAQLYEQSIVALWDSIRLKKNKFEQIEKFSFDKIKIPKFSKEVLIDKGISKNVI